MQREVPIDFAERAAKGLENFFGRFVSADTAQQAVDIFVTAAADGAEVGVELGTPLQFFLTGTGVHGPEQSEFVVASTNNVLSWEEGGERHFASYVHNPGMEPKFSEDDIRDAISRAIVEEED